MEQKEFTDIEEEILDVVDRWIEKIKQGLEKIERIFSRMDEKEEEEEEKEGDGTFKKVAEIAVLSSQIPPLIPEEEENDDKIS